MNKFDSNEEQYLDWWLQELKEAGYVKEIIHQPKSYELSSQIKRSYFEPYKRKNGGKSIPEEILPAHIYTPDIKVIWDNSALYLFTLPIDSIERKKKGRSFQYILSDIDDGTGDHYSIIEVKPSFDQNNMTRLAKINIKWVYEKYGEFVNIVVPEKHFAKTFTPKKFLFTNKTKKPRKLKYSNVKTLEEFLSERNSGEELSYRKRV